MPDSVVFRCGQCGRDCEHEFIHQYSKTLDMDEHWCWDCYAIKMFKAVGNRILKAMKMLNH